MTHPLPVPWGRTMKRQVSVLVFFVFFFLFFEVVLTSRPDDAQCRATLPISRILGRIGGSQVTTDMRDHAFFHVPTREV